MRTRTSLPTSFTFRNNRRRLAPKTAIECVRRAEWGMRASCHVTAGDEGDPGWCLRSVRQKSRKLWACWFRMPHEQHSYAMWTLLRHMQISPLREVSNHLVTLITINVASWQVRNEQNLDKINSILHFGRHRASRARRFSFRKYITPKKYHTVATFFVAIS